jgi:DNA-binding transcriptional LysR family regulator
VAFVRGVTPGKWEKIWRERRPDREIELFLTEADGQAGVVKNGGADLAFVRLPVDREGLNVISLYTEMPVVVVPRGHAISAADEVSTADLEDEQLHEPVGDIAAVFTLVAAGIGLVVVPQSIARLHARRDLVALPVIDIEGTQIALVWPSSVGDDDRDVGDFIGIVRGRTPRSSRGADPKHGQAASKDRTKANQSKPARTKPAQKRPSSSPSRRKRRGS